MEQLKFDAQMRMFDAVQGQQMDPILINGIIKNEEIKAGDKLFL